MQVPTSAGPRAVHEQGLGAAVVLVHGSWDDHQEWAPVADVLAEGFRVVSYDRRGHGPDEDRSVSGSRSDDEDDLASVMTGLAAGPVHVVGTSFGASVAIGLAARGPELFGSLTLHEPPLLGIVAEDPDARGVLAALASVVELIDRGEAEAGRNGSSRTSPSAREPGTSCRPRSAPPWWRSHRPSPGSSTIPRGETCSWLTSRR